MVAKREQKVKFRLIGFFPARQARLDLTIIPE